MIYFIALIIIYALHIVFRLHWSMMVVLGIYALCILPVHKGLAQKEKVYRERFFEASFYLDALLYGFLKEEKVQPAIASVRESMPEGRMKELVGNALDYMMLTYDEVEVLEEALGKIAGEYPCKRIQNVHKFITHVEYYGGEVEKPVSLLLADKSRWESRMKMAMNQRKKQFTDILLSVAASFVICGAILHLPIGEVDISLMWPVQIAAVVVIVLDDVAVLLAQRYLAVDWIGMQLTEEESYYEKKMEEFCNFQMEKEKRLSLILGMVGLICTAVALISGNRWVILGGMLLTLVFFNQHKIGKGLLIRRLTGEIRYAFPNWLLDLVLLLQSENVQMALLKSAEYVPGVLKKELMSLTEQLQMQPESSEPYHNFLKEFAVPEIHSAMGILFSLSIGNSGNGEKQLSELVDKNLELLDMTETERLKNSAAGMYVLFLVPVLTASFKLVMDMVVLMMQFLSMTMM